jgi:DNA-binding MarR family transcriptional regulator
MSSFDVAQISDVVHERIRLGIMAYLADAEVASFNDLKTRLNTTQGNLSVHLRKLENAGYVAIQKTFVARKPLTRVRLTPSGRKAFIAYLDSIAKLIEDRESRA